MKKWLFSICLLSIFLLAGCWNNPTIEQKISNAENETWVEIGQSVTLEGAIFNYIEDNYSCDDWSKLFVNYAELWQDNADFYINAIGEWFYIDERWNLNNSCGFSIPMKVTVSTQDWSNYVVTDVVQAKDWSDYDKSIREMFSEEAVRKLFNEDYEFLDGRSLLEMAEEYFGITIIPETENNFECKFCDKLLLEQAEEYFGETIIPENENNFECNFCDKLRYYNPFDDADLYTNDLIFNYVSSDNWNNTIYFGSDWSFKAEWSWDAWEWTRTFGQDENTVIVLINNLDHVYDRYIITNQTEDSLNTILEIIQRR